MCRSFLRHLPWPPPTPSAHQYAPAASLTSSAQVKRASSSGVHDFLSRTNTDAIEALNGDLSKLLRTIPEHRRKESTRGHY